MSANVPQEAVDLVALEVARRRDGFSTVTTRQAVALILAVARDALANGGQQAEQVAAALGLTDQWAVRFERKGDPTMGNASGVTTVEQIVRDETVARQAVRNGVPISATNRRLTRRVVGPWVEVPE